MLADKMRVIADIRERPDVGGVNGLFTYSGDMKLLPARSPRVRISKGFLQQVAVGEVVSTGHETSIADFLVLTVLVPLQGHITTEVNGRELSVETGEALILPPGARRTRVRAHRNRPFRAFPVLIPPPLLRQTLEAAEFTPRQMRELKDKAVQMSAQRSIVDANLIALVGRLRDLADGTDAEASGHIDPEHWVRLLMERLVAVLGPERQKINMGSPGQSGRHVSRATDYMYAHFPEIRSIVEVAEICGVSVRTLEHAFQVTWGISPQKALKIIRLDAARLRLTSSRGEMSVTDIAMECGFTHLGRFSAEYRSRYGELPSRHAGRE